jgi:hypothetical protein
MEYIDVTPTTSEKISEVEKEINYTFPEDFRNDAIKLNYGRPTRCLYMVGNVERFIERFSSMNKEDLYGYYSFKNYVFNNYVFFAEDSFGNSLAFNRLDNAIYFFDHEMEDDDAFTKVASSWTEFKDMLYEPIEE